MSFTRTAWRVQFGACNGGHGAQLRKLREAEAVRRGAGGEGGGPGLDEALGRYELDMRLLQVRLGSRTERPLQG